jgi:hypothetical protein
MSAVSYVTVLCLTPDTCTGCYVTIQSIAQRANTVVTVTGARTAVFRSLYRMARVVVQYGLHLVCPGFDFRWDEALHSSIY